MPNTVLTRSQSPRGARSQLIVVNLPASGLVALLLFIGQFRELGDMPAIPLRDFTVIVFSFLTLSVFLAMIPALVSGMLWKYCNGYLSVGIWLVSFSLSTIYFWDRFGYQWVGLHLTESVPLLIQNLNADFQIYHSKLVALVAAVSTYVAFLIAGVPLGRWIFARFPVFQKPVGLSLVLWLLILASTAYVVEQLLAPYTMTAEGYRVRSIALWQPTFGSRTATEPLLVLNSVRFKQLPDPQVVERDLARVTPQAVRHPLNVFLFVIESLRASDISPEITPRLWALSRRSLAPGYGIASGNCTHISWYSIMNGTDPLYWSVLAHQAHSNGAVTVRALKRAGYTIRVIATPLLSYFNFEHSTFGDKGLADSVIDQSRMLNPNDGDNKGELDERVVTRLLADLDRLNPHSRSFYLIMLDAPHHDYSWAKDFKPPFEPFMPKVPLLASSITNANVGLLRNRYKDAVSFEDLLLGRFLAKMKERNLLGNSMIIVTGDHGEEFLERGHLVHSSAFDSYQLRVPIIFYIPDGLAGENSNRLASHSSIFPTVFDVLGLGDEVNPLMDGKSLLGEHANNFAVSAMCSSYSPSTVLIDGGDDKLEVRFAGIGKIGHTLIARNMLGIALYDKDYDRPSGSDIKIRAQALFERFAAEVLAR
jgi:hypothetical protein